MKFKNVNRMTNSGKLGLNVRIQLSLSEMNITEDIYSKVSPCSSTKKGTELKVLFITFL